MSSTDPLLTPITHTSLYAGVPTGRVMTLHSLPCYIAEAPSDSPRGIIILIPSATGWSSSHNRVLADTYALKGNFTVLLPDLMNGHAVPETVQDSFKTFKRTSLFTSPLVKLAHLLHILRYMLPFAYHCRPAAASPRIATFLTAIKQAEARKGTGKLPLGAVGVAWGGYFVVRACAGAEPNGEVGKGEKGNEGGWEGEKVLDAAFVAHPSNLTYPRDVKRIAVPVSWAAAETDRHMSPSQAETTKKILAGKTARAKDEDGNASAVGRFGHEFAMYEGVRYGFAQGGMRKKVREAEAGERAEEQAVQWFRRCFGTASEGEEESLAS